MPFIKTVWNFSANPSGRWSEILHAESDSFAAVRGACTTLIPKRLKFLHPTCTLTKIQMTKVNALRETAPIPVNLPGSILPGTKNPANLGEVAVVTLGSLDPPSTRKIWLGGLEEDAVYRNLDSGATELDATFRNDLQAWIDELTTNTIHWCVLKRHPGGSVLAPLHSVVEVKPSVLFGNANAEITLNPAPDVEIGETMVFRKVNKKILPGLEGEFTVIFQEANKVIVRYRTPELRTIATGGGEAYVLKYVDGTDLDADACGFSYLGVRQRKNEDTGSRGSKSAVRIRGL